MRSYSSNYLRLISCTKLLASHVNAGRHEEALLLFQKLNSSTYLSLDSFFYPLTLKSCAALGRPQLGASIHAYASKTSLLSNPFMACALVDMYGKCVSIFKARYLFDELPHRNVVVWNAMISLHARSGSVSDALQLFEQMEVAPNVSTFNTIIYSLTDLGEGASKAFHFHRRMQILGLRPNLMTLLALLHSCLAVAALNLIREIHGYSIRNSIDPHTQLRSALVEAYGRCGCLRLASIMFDSLSERDVVAWSSLISAYALYGEAGTALKIFEQMEFEAVKPDGITFLAVLKACSHAGLAEEAKLYLSRMSKDYNLEPSSDHYACFVDVLSRAGSLNEAYEVIRQMPMKATAKAWGALLGSCTTYGDMELAKIACLELVQLEPKNAANYVLLARIYANCGRYEDALKVRREMENKGVTVGSGSSWFTNRD